MNKKISFFLDDFELGKDSVLGIYIHIPFCEKRCNYCHFFSRILKPNHIEKFFEALVSEIEYYEKTDRNLFEKSFVDSIYFGGGTPSMVKPFVLKNLIEILGSKFNFKNPEITLEAHPKSFLENYKDKNDVFFNRLSLGIVSFEEKELLNLNRENFGYPALILAKELGIENVNVDLLIGIPGQNLASFKKSLDIICQFDNVRGVSIYPLEADFVESDEKVLELMDYSEEYLDKMGYIRYEIANYAKDGFFCRHNLKYWEYMNFLSFGPSSSSKIGNHRFKRSSNLNSYLEKKFFLEEDIRLSEEDLFFEKIMMGLRLMKGIKISELETQFDKGLVEDFLIKIKKFEELVKIENDMVFLTKKGIIFMNDFLVEIMPDRKVL
ncbi:oxygen-independent coproporphyrinogen-3 oxidase [Thermodesulfobium acidiphilum]|uniref:Oxygen-independent coproporphyrinogen-3 oxidase n=1 Tax=Thermodesulfobium acidiphilum TaxID=1794699 RepID=A0A2R4VYF9_THEAF|nr:coproporphyrinogen-III oxidase family protein [Thermodesulfobium acidiphilum]AWB09573.1 oxygen-independent coproporphyrinogen-3 oxidase [Thermodesulfobium acidiphilum]